MHLFKYAPNDEVPCKTSRAYGRESDPAVCHGFEKAYRECAENDSSSLVIRSLAVLATESLHALITVRLLYLSLQPFH